MNRPDNIVTPTGNAFEHNSDNSEYDPERDQMYFEMQDNNGSTFCIGLTTLLKCLAFAERQHELPHSGYPWWNGVIDHYHLDRGEIFGDSNDDDSQL